MDAKSSSPPTAERRRNTSFRRYVRWLCGLAAAAATAYALTQAPRRDPLEPAGFGEWFRSPVEKNAFRRLPYVRSELQWITTRDAGRHVWAVGTAGVVMHSTDGGRTWNQGQLVVPGKPGTKTWLNSLNSVHFKDARNGIAVGQSQIARTTDGGQNWSTTPRVFAGDEFDVHSVQLTSSGDGLAATDSGLVETTTGELWQKGDLRQPLISVSLTEEVAVALAADRHLFVRQSGAGSWSDVTSALAVTGGNEPTVPTAIAAVNSSVYAAVQHSSSTGVSPAAILHSTDAGKRWEVEPWLAGFDPAWGSIRQMHFAAPDHLWVVTALGLLLRAERGGSAWAVRRTGVVSVSFADADHGYAVTTHNDIIKTGNGGRTWRVVAGAPEFKAAHYFDEESGIAVGANGLVATTEDGGRTWSTATVGNEAHLNAVASPDGVHSWVAGDDGTIRLKSSRRAPWEELVTIPSRRPIRAMAVAPGTSAFSGERFAVTDAGEVYGQVLGGAWQRIGSIPDTAIQSLEILNSGSCIVLGSTAIWKSTNRCRSWSPIRLGAFSAVDFQNDAFGWAARREWMLRTRDGGTTWDSANLGTRDRVNAIRFVNQSVGWAVGRNARVWQTQYGGSSWQLMPIKGVDTAGKRPDLLDLVVLEDTLVRAVGEGGTVAEGTRAGEWKLLVEAPSHQPAPWYWAMLALCAIAAILARERSEPASIVGPKDIFTSDRALRPGDTDLLGFEKTARGLSRFLRNKATEPPLTIAITGVWGRGKTSLMNLVRADLVRSGERVVWFNAWDHQNEESLLASLLATIQVQAVPSILNPLSALRFRGQLVWHRLFADTARGKPRTAAYTAFFALFALLSVALATPTAISRFLLSLTGIVTAIGSPGGLSRWWTTVTTAAERAGGWEILLLLTSATTFAVAIARTLKAFGVKPGILIAPVTRAARLRDLEESTGFRHRFAQDFQSVMAALRPHRLTIFIDDLDRCTPEGVRTVLEAVNFLSQSGECLIVLGMNGQIVRRDIYRHFLKAAKEARELNAADCGDARSIGEEAHAHADGFFEKLINIEVRLPAPHADRVAGIIKDPEGPEEPSADAASAARRRETRRQIARLGMLALAAIATMRVLLSLPDDPVPIRSHLSTPAAALSTGTAVPPAAVTTIPSTQGTTEISPRVLASIPSRQGAVLAAREPRRTGLWILWPVLLLVGVMAAHVMLRPEYVVKDSKEFRDALNAWAPLLSRELHTPRAAKRFLNRLRYYAMMEIGDPPVTTRTKAFLAWIRWPWFRKNPDGIELSAATATKQQENTVEASGVATTDQEPLLEPAPAAVADRGTAGDENKKIPEQLLVALAAIEVLDPSMLEPSSSKKLAQDFHGTVRERFGPEDTDAITRLKYPGPLSNHILRFRELSGSVDTH